MRVPPCGSGKSPRYGCARGELNPHVLSDTGPEPCASAIPPLARAGHEGYHRGRWPPTTSPTAGGASPGQMFGGVLGPRDRPPPVGARRFGGRPQRFEDRLDRLVNGAFARAFAEVQPVEVAATAARAAMTRLAVVGRSRTVAPNPFTVTLVASDFERLAPVRARR